MPDFFFYGTLRHPPLLETVLGRRVATEPARLPGHEVRAVAGETFPILCAGPGHAEGVLARGLTEADVLRLDFYEGGFSYCLHEIELVAGGVRGLASVFVAPPDYVAAGPWDFAAWQERWGPTVTAAAADYMRAFGQHEAPAVLGRYPQMLIRAGARVRAAQSAPASLRRRAAEGDVVELAFRLPYARYFAVEEYDLRFRRFDGGLSEPVTRAVFVTGDAAVVLPYDPVRDRVLVVEQFRPGPHARGDRQPWLIEAVAGRVDGGETPEEAARREAAEEAGLRLAALVPGPGFYPSPAAKSEYIYTFVGIADLPDGAAGTGGVAGEAEDIRTHVLPFGRLMDLVASGEVDNAPLLILAQWLAGQRGRLRADGT